MGQITKKQIIKSVIFTLIGAASGKIWFFNAGTAQSVIIGCLGAFIAFAFSLPGVIAFRFISSAMTNSAFTHTFAGFFLTVGRPSAIALI